LTNFSVHILQEDVDHVSLAHAYSLLEKWGRILVLMSNMTVRRVIWA